MSLDVIQRILPSGASTPIYLAAWIFTGIVFLITALLVFFLYWGEGRRRGKKSVKAVAKPEETQAEASPEEAPAAREEEPSEESPAAREEEPSEEAPAAQEEPSEEKTEKAPIPEEPTPDANEIS